MGLIEELVENALKEVDKNNAKQKQKIQAMKQGQQDTSLFS